MKRYATAVVLLILFAVPTAAGQADASAGSENSAAEAKATFDQLQKQWVELTVQLRQKAGEKEASNPSQRGPLDEEINQLRLQTEQLVDQIIEVGLEVYRSDPKSYPVVNKTLLTVAGFYVTGDRSGDGGDQYEKALPIINTLLDAGAGSDSPELWLWGAVSAYQTNDYDLAARYFAQARSANLLGSSPPSRSQDDPRNRLWELAQGGSESLEANRKAWQVEHEIRAAEAQADDLPRVKLVTSRGEFVIELFENEAPQAVASFLTLVKQGFYDGIVFHRVLPAFMAQGGDPTGTGSGGPGYSIRCECHQPGYRKHFRGSLSMAHAGRDTGGSQFFLTFVSTSYLDGRHTVFGRVVEGMEVAASLKRRDPNDQNAPEPDRILKAEVLRDRGHEYQFEKLPER